MLFNNKAIATEQKDKIINTEFKSCLDNFLVQYTKITAKIEAKTMVAKVIISGSLISKNKQIVGGNKML